MKKNSRDIFFKIRINEEEKKLIDSKFKLSGFISKSQFIRKMIFNGVVIKDNDKIIQKNIRSVANIAANIGQISVRLNAVKSDCANEVVDLQNEVNEIFRRFIKINCELKRFTE